MLRIPSVNPLSELLLLRSPLLARRLTRNKEWWCLRGSVINSSTKMMHTNQGPIWQHSNLSGHNTNASNSQHSSKTGICWTLPQAQQWTERTHLLWFMMEIKQQRFSGMCVNIFFWNIFGIWFAYFVILVCITECYLQLWDNILF
jgi:hypothetical protein